MARGSEKRKQTTQDENVGTTGNEGMVIHRGRSGKSRKQRKTSSQVQQTVSPPAKERAATGKNNCGNTQDTVGKRTETDTDCDKDKGGKGSGVLRDTLLELEKQSKIMSPMTDSATTVSFDTAVKLTTAEHEAIKLMVKKELFPHVKLIYKEEQMSYDGAIAHVFYKGFGMQHLSVADKVAWWSEDKKRLIRNELNLKRNNVGNLMKVKFWGEWRDAEAMLKMGGSNLLAAISRNDEEERWYFPVWQG